MARPGCTPDLVLLIENRLSFFLKKELTVRSRRNLPEKEDSNVTTCQINVYFNLELSQAALLT